MMKLVLLAAAVAAALTVPTVAPHAGTLSAAQMAGPQNQALRNANRPARQVQQPRRSRAGAYPNCTVNLSGRCQRHRNVTGRRTSSLLRY